MTGQMPVEIRDAGSFSTLSDRLRIFLTWGFLVGVVFFSVYPTINWVTSLRNGHYSLYTRYELNIPFVPEFIWFYLSMYLLFALPPFFLGPSRLKVLAKLLILGTILAGGIFLLFPAQLGFVRTLPGDEFYDALFLKIFSLDHPYNLVPSLHVIYSTIICLEIINVSKRSFRLFMWLWLVLINISTILVHQHHILDVSLGVLLAVLVRSIWEKKNV